LVLTYFCTYGEFLAGSKALTGLGLGGDFSGFYWNRGVTNGAGSGEYFFGGSFSSFLSGDFSLG
jgi:hypothetical protein